MATIPIPGVETVETHWIPMADGRRLAARLFLPVDARQNPVPLILEYIPYRRRDGTRIGDDQKHLYFAGHGYASARVDIAGMGDSDGLLDDEYVKREQDDALEILDHLCAQPWCSGKAGMIGISWGGFSGLQVAARRPPQLKAIVTTCSTDDRYGCDAHYSGGLLINDNFGWGGALFGYAALPPDPAVVGEDRWRDIWRQRLSDHKNHAALWLHHQRRDDFWKHGSVCEDYSAITCAVLAVGGFLDGYTPTIFRLLENLSAPVKGLCGPWGHKEPHNGTPQPAIGFLQECVRWFDHWIKGVDNGVDADPALRVYIMDYARPQSHFEERSGRWLGFKHWPAPQIETRSIPFETLGLTGQPLDKGGRVSISSPLTTGLMGQEWCPYGQGRISAEGARDQRTDDAGSLCFDSAALDRDMTVLGVADVTLRIASDKPQAQICVRLTDVAPDGTSALLTFALLNLGHHRSHEHPEPLKAGAFIDVSLALKPVAQVIPKGHRLRVAVSSSYWPLAWPSPERTTLTLDPAGCRLDVPLLSREENTVPVAFEPAVSAEPGKVSVLEPDNQTRSVIYDIVAESVELNALSDDGRYIIEETGTEVAAWRRKSYVISKDDPASCATTITCHHAYKRPDWDVHVDAEITTTCTATHFHATGWVRAYDRGELFAERRYDELIPRDCL